MSRFAVIDTETNWAGQVMSIGVVAAESETFRALESRYVVDPYAASVGGMYEMQLYWDTPVKPILTDRETAARETAAWLRDMDVNRIFAYNAGFDKNLLPELQKFCWHDIMRLAAYRQHNPSIPECADCYKTGRLRRGYGVEPILQLLSGNFRYRETHNALMDALDELKIMELLGYEPERYPQI